MAEIAKNRIGEPIVLVERHGHVAVVRMNRPEARNAMSEELLSSLTSVWNDLEADDDVWVYIITGNDDKAFCAGADLKAVATRNVGGSSGRVAGMSADPPDSDAVGFGGVTPRLRKPIIAAVNGYALGGGCELCLSCDLIVAEEHAQIGLPEVRRGIVPGAGGVERLPRRIPPTLAMEAILTGVPFTAQRAYEIGLINRVVPAGAGVGAALELAQSICEGAPLAVRYAKAVARATFSLGEGEARTRNHEAGLAFATSEDALEGPRAFADKRVPRWKGR